MLELADELNVQYKRKREIEGNFKITGFNKCMNVSVID